MSKKKEDRVGGEKNKICENRRKNRKVKKGKKEKKGRKKEERENKRKKEREAGLRRGTSFHSVFFHLWILKAKFTKEQKNKGT